MTQSTKTRYWYTVRASWFWGNGWCFGETPEAAAKDAVESAERFEKRIPAGAPITVHLQSSSDYDDPKPAEYFTIELAARIAAA